MRKMDFRYNIKNTNHESTIIYLFNFIEIRNMSCTVNIIDRRDISSMEKCMQAMYGQLLVVTNKSKPQY